MIQVDISYNPFDRSTSILVDKKKITSKNSNLIISKGVRLQEWVDQLPQWLCDEYNASEYHIIYHGTREDYDDILYVISEFRKINNDITFTSEFDETINISNVEKGIVEIYNEIQSPSCPIKELQSDSIKHAFAYANNSTFEINVVATMSAGKSTLINSLLGKKLMPVANQATTATIVRITDNDNPTYTAIARNADGQEIKYIDSLTLEDMKAMNSDDDVSYIDINCDIPFIAADSMRLVLIDTPGPDNARNADHRYKTYNLIKNSDKSLVLVVIDGTKEGNNSQSDLLEFISDEMNKCGKQSRDRYIFVVNKLDTYNSENEDIEGVLSTLRNTLEKDYKIIKPNIFPISAEVAFQARRPETEPKHRKDLNNFVISYENDEMFFLERYNNYNNLPNSIQNQIEKRLESCDKDGQAEIHSGIVSVEKAISLYVYKYARVDKICDLISSFKYKVDEMKIYTELESKLASDKEKRSSLAAKIEKAEAFIKDKKRAEDTLSMLQNVDLITPTKNKVVDEIASSQKQIRKAIFDLTTSGYKIKKSFAETKCKEIEGKIQIMEAQLRARIDTIIEDTYKDCASTLINTYVDEFSKLGLSSDGFDFNPCNIISSEFTSLKKMIKNNVDLVMHEDESYYKNVSYQEREYYTVKVPHTERYEQFVPSKKRWYNLWLAKGDHYETRTRTVMKSEERSRMVTKTRKQRVEKFVDYVDMQAVSVEYMSEFDDALTSNKNNCIQFVTDETQRLKDFLIGQVERIEKIAQSRCQELIELSKDEKKSNDAIQKTQKALEWIRNIENKINKLVPSYN